mgnify:CR=1 FL=1
MHPHRRINVVIAYSRKTDRTRSAASKLSYFRHCVPVNQWSRDGKSTPSAVNSAAARSQWSLNSAFDIIVGVVVVRFGSIYTCP